MRLTPTARMVRDCRLSTNLATGADGLHFSGVIRLQNMLLTNIVRLEDRNERGRRRPFLDVGPASGLLAFHEAHRANDYESEITRCLNRLYGGCTSRADVIDNYYPRAFLAEAFNALTRAMLFLGFTHEEAVQLAARD